MTLREWRDKLGLTQQQLADRSHLSVPSISNIETGKFSPTKSSRVLLCMALSKAHKAKVKVEDVQWDVQGGQVDG